MAGFAIKAEEIGKKYRVKSSNRSRYLSLRDELTAFFSTISLRSKNKQDEFWALNDINFEIEQGEIVGIIGRNGAGKSTLLKLIARITTPTTGKLTINGRVGSLLEVGTGFHPELTGRENIYLSGAILGMGREEVKRKFDEIVDFAGVEAFLETPVKRYSSGMYVRLGFAIAAFLEPEILIIDEVLTVGDIEFQKRCLNKLESTSKSGRTVIIVSHNIGIINQLCSSCLLISEGYLQAQGEVKPILDSYTKEALSSFNTISQALKINFKGANAHKVKFLDILIDKVNPIKSELIISGLKPIIIQLYLGVKSLGPTQLNLSIYKNGVRLFTLQDQEPSLIPDGTVEAWFQLPAKLLRPGIYSISCGGSEYGIHGEWFWIDNLCTFQILEEWDEDVKKITPGIINVMEAQTRRILPPKTF